MQLNATEIKRKVTVGVPSWLSRIAIRNLSWRSRGSVLPMVDVGGKSAVTDGSYRLVLRMKERGDVRDGTGKAILTCMQALGLT